MASIVLSVAGSAVGGSIGGPIGAFIGGSIGRAAGGVIDSALFSSTKKLPHVNGPRLAELGVQTSTYGKMIPIVYGTARIGGNVIWSRPIRETATTTTSTTSAGGGKGGGGKVAQSSTTYSYSVTLAVALCEGQIDEVLRMWADARQLDMSQYTIRVYKGSETQFADSLITSIEGGSNTPAYRGLAYVVIEDFPLADYGNRIPNFTFEVRRKMKYADYDDESLEDMIKGMVMIPGAGEFVYDTQVQYKIPGAQVGADWVQQGYRDHINMHNGSGQANALLALDQLENTCPNVEWVSVVVCWFGDDMDAGACVVKPGVEYQSGATTAPGTWQVGSFIRGTAKQITIVDDYPQYGGTPDDGSLLRYLDELKARGYNIMFYPMMFMDVAGKPWRGEVTGSAADVASFFTKTNGYNAFITHYANLVYDKVDAFIIGSELVGLTKVTDTPGNYPAVNELVSLAATVRSIVGGSVKVTYAADWSEYHHTDGGWYNLDPLWSSSNIDMIGIDAYFPLSDEPQSEYDVEALIDGWTSGEGYDWYYTDTARTVQASLAPEYAWKNIAWFYNNYHVNPDMNTTAWIPASKKIWFTEYGFPSVDGAANQPNVFYDGISTGSAFPRFSMGRVDFRSQRAGLVATEQKWKTSAIVERMFVWTWDARPYPYWPDLMQVWSDGNAWKTGHWVQGKLGISSLAAIVAELCIRAGLEEDEYDVSRITDQVEGYIISQPQSLRECVEQLQQAYFFDVVESDYTLRFVPRGQDAEISISQDELVPPDSDRQGELLTIGRAQEIELPWRIYVKYLNRLANYQTATQYAQRETTSSRESVYIDLPIVFSDQLGKTIADKTLFAGWVGRTTYGFHLPPKYMHLDATDVLEVGINGVTHTMRVTEVSLGASFQLQVSAVAENVAAYDFYTPPGEITVGTSEVVPVAVTRLELLDLPALPGDDATSSYMRLAANGLSLPWSGCVVYRSEDNAINYDRLADIASAAAIGVAQTALAVGSSAMFDDANTVDVLLLGDSELVSVSEMAVLNGANAALIGNEVIQFKNATLQEPGKYRLSGLLRGRLGTEHAIDGHAAGERFVLLDGRVIKSNMQTSLYGAVRQYKPVSINGTLGVTAAQDFKYRAVALKPYSPVHLTSSRDGSGNITLSWVRRTRVGGDWNDYVDAALSEQAEAYEVDILDGSNVVRVLTGLNAAAATYSAAEQVADFGSVQSSVTVSVYQLSALVGRGYPCEAVV